MQKFVINSLVMLILDCTVFASNFYVFDPKAAIEWQNTFVDFGKVSFGKPVTAEFIFKNPSMIPLIIIEVKPTCGCTIANYPKQPILPGQQDKITVIYDTKLSGYFSKTISVSTNTEEGITELIIKGEVIK
jgi:hypothetical protein